MKKIKVIHIWKNFDTYNGMVEILLYLAKYYDRDKLDFGACVFNDKGSMYSQRFRELGGELYNMKCENGLSGHVKFLQRMIIFLKNENPDVVITHDRRCNLYGIMAAKQAKVPVIVSMETTLMDSATTRIKRFRDKLLHPLFRSVIWSSDMFLTTSACIQQFWIRKLTPSKFKVIYPPFNLDKYNAVFSPGGIERKSEGFPSLGYIGRLSEEKGLHYLIRSLPRIRNKFPSLRLLVAGAGEMEDSFKMLAKDEKVDDCINFLGFQHNPFSVLKRIDLLVVPSRTDGCPIAIVEAMASGVPVLASNIGGIPELITEETGRLVPPKDINALAAAITDLLEQPEEMLEMGTHGYERAFTQFEPLKFVRELEKLFGDLLTEKQKTY